MTIREDKSYLSSIDIKAIDRGIAELDIHSLKISRRKYTEEEMANNKRVADNSSRESWIIHCNTIKKEVAAKVIPLMEFLSTKFDIYQYKKEGMIHYNSNWDLFFWCNCNEEGRDMSYVTLNPNTNRTLEQRKQDINNTLNYIKEFGFEGLDIVIQYKAHYDDEKLSLLLMNTFKMWVTV